MIFPRLGAYQTDPGHMMIKKILLLIFALLVLLVGYSAVRAPTPPIPFDPHDPVANAAAKKRWADSDRLGQIANVKILKWSWKKGGFNNVMIGTFTIQNTNEFGVKDIVISCKHFAPSGTLIDTNTKTVYQAIKSKASLTIKDFNMGLLHTQAAESSCSVKDFV